MSAWSDFLDARLRLVHEWAAQGIPGETDSSPEAIAAQLNRHDAGQIRLLLMTPLQPPIPGSLRSKVGE